MSGARTVVAALLAFALICASCTGGDDPADSLGSSVAEPTAPAVTSAESPPATSEVDAEAPSESGPALVATEPDGPFECANQQPGEVIDDAGLAADLAEFVGPRVPGLVAATVSSDGLLRIGAAGVRAMNADEALMTTDRMHLGSDTKAMTATLLALLSQDFDIALTTAITDIWPEADEGWAEVTLLDLLHHRGGAEDSLASHQRELWLQLWMASSAAHSGDATARASAAQAARTRLADELTSTQPQEPVGQFVYSNAGYILVGAAIEASLGVPWEILMCEHLFQPLRMDGCGFGAPPAPGPQGHRESARDLLASRPNDPLADNPAALGPAGTVYCPLADWSRYVSWVLRGARGEDDLLPAETWQTLLEPEGEYAAGWGVTRRPWASGRIYTHNGSNTMWWSTVWVAPELDRAFLAASNAATPEAQVATDQAINVLISGES